MTRLLAPLLSFLLASAALGTAIPAAAQSGPDLSGTWVADEAKSDAGALQAGGGGGGFGARGGGVPPNQLVITQSPTELTVARGNQTFAYRLDGSESPGPPGGETKSQISWEGGKLVVTWKREYYAGAQLGYATTSGKDVYTLNGNTLTVERQSVSPKGERQTRTIVYTKS